jgi:hypothetical protein
MVARRVAAASRRALARARRALGRLQDPHVWNR